MNRRHESLSAQANKQNIKEIKSSIDRDTVSLKAESQTITTKAPSLKRVSTSKRTSPKEKIVNTTPSHPHKEGSRWAEMLQRQTTENNLRMTKQADKHLG